MSKFDPQSLVNLGRVTSVAASRDGTWLAVSVGRLDDETQSKYVSDIWRVPLDGGEPVQLTRHAWNDHSPAFMADGSLAFLSNRPTGDGDEDHEKRAQVFAMRPWGGEPVCLTSEPLGVLNFEAAASSDTLVVMAPVLLGVDHDEQRETLKERQERGPTALKYDRMPVRFWDHWLPEQVPHLIVYEDGERTDVTPAFDRELFQAAYDVAPDGGWVALHPLTSLREDRLQDQRAEILDLDTGARRVLAETERGRYFSPVIAPEGRRIAMMRRRRREGEFGKSDLIVVDVESGEQTVLGEDFDGWLQPHEWTPDGAEILATAADRTHAPVFAVHARTGAVRRITAKSAGGSHTSITFVGGDHARIAGARSTVTTPWEPFVCALKEGAEPELVARLSGFDAPDDIVAENHTVESTDGTDVQYRIVRPKDGGNGTTVMWIHGGPVSDWGDIWHWRWNAVCAVERGYTMVLPNPRGSTGFGQEFVEGIWNNEWGGQCYEDLMAVADEVAARDDVEQMVAMGGSFGGYMTNWIGTQTARFACLITHASIFDLAAFHGVTDMPAWWAFSFGVHPYDERGEFERYSPIAHVDQWESPTLIIHGEKDFRVPVGEALAMFEALKFHGVDARLLVFPDENHWILRPRNIVTWYEEVFDFIDEQVGGGV